MLELVRNMGRLGIEVLCYNWMAVVPWSRTSSSQSPRAGAPRRPASSSPTWADGPDAPDAPVAEERLWESLGWFLERAVPVAEEAGVRLALHPDDPPLSPLRGIGRIVRSLDAYDRVFELQPSPANGMTLCQGNVALMTDDLPAAIRRFGAEGRIHFVHFRDVRGTPERFVETFVDDGPTDMAACIRAYLEAGVDAPLRTDHSPALTGDDWASPAIRRSGGSTPSGTSRGSSRRSLAAGERRRRDRAFLGLRQLGGRERSTVEQVALAHLERIEPVAREDRPQHDEAGDDHGRARRLEPGHALRARRAGARRAARGLGRRPLLQARRWTTLPPPTSIAAAVVTVPATPIALSDVERREERLDVGCARRELVLGRRVRREGTAR